MELRDALRTTGAIRQFTNEPVDTATLHRVLDNARFAPSGGNRQGWRLIVVEDPGLRQQLRDLYLRGWYDYLAIGAAGLVGWAPVTDREAEARALEQAPDMAARAAATPERGGFAEHLDEVPVLMILLADLRALAAVDRDFDRYTLVGGASIYPFAWSVLLAAREEGLGGVITTMLTREEPAVRGVLGIPGEFAVVAGIALGHPVKQPTRLRRQEVEEFTTVDRFDGAAFTAGPQPGG